MVCYHPLHAFPNGFTKDGKQAYKITSNKVMSVSFDKSNGHWYMSTDKNRYANNKFIDIPCNQCIGCRIDYSRQWAVRCVLESYYHSQTWFLTITYDDEHVPHSAYIDNITGEVKDILTLDSNDFTKFLKRLRYYYKEKTGKEFRYFSCGEYGSKTLRPHYHMIAFGLELDDLKLVKQSPTGGNLYESELVNKAWKRGYVLLSESNFDTCAYTARYVMKKRKGKDADEYEFYNIEKEFVRMSRNKGIGYEYYQEHKHEIYEHDEIILVDGKKFKPPKFFDDMYEAEFPEKFEKVREARIKAVEVSDDTKEQLYGDKYLRLSREEVCKKASVSKLKREL